MIELFFDGASRGNPGYAGAGAWITVKTPQPMSIELKENLGIATNNQAEYEGLLLGLRKIHDLLLTQQIDGDTNLTIKGDSELIIKQLLGQYKVKSDKLRLFYQEVKELLMKISKYSITVNFEHIKRHLNSMADKLANAAIDNI